MERLHMNYLRDLVHRLRAGQSQRRIAKDLPISRPTIRKYWEMANERGYLDRSRPMPADSELSMALGPAPQPRTPSSGVAPYHELVERLLDQGVEMTAICARLRENHGFTGSYSSIRRYVHGLCREQPEAFVRVHTAPGEEAQVDFGSVGSLRDPRTGGLRTAYAFVATLSFSRHQYAELVFDQKIPTWIGLHRRAFESWGGIPRRLVPDNLKAAVLEALVDGPVLGEAYRRMAQHYGFVISPTRPATPQHKGKVENGIHYLKRNFMAGQEFADIDVANRRLGEWVREVAGTRRHGTTHQVPLRLFAEEEKAHLEPLPPDPFTLLEIKPVKVHPDCHVTIAGSYYSVPYVHLGQTLDAYVGERVVQLFRGADLITTHPRATAPGQWLTHLQHYPQDKALFLERTPERCRQIAQRIGPATHQIVVILLAERPLDRLRSVQAILRFEESVGARRLEAACARAIHFGDIRHRRIKEILNAALDREPLPETSSALPQRTYAFARSGHEFFAQQETLL